MAIQNRRGVYDDFDPSKMVEGEWAVVQSGDPNSERGRSVYMAFQNGEVERMATYEDMSYNIDSKTADIQATLTQNVSQAITDANSATNAANSAASDASDAADSAASAAQSASTAASNANTATSSANQATTRANNAASDAEQAKTAAETATQEAVAATSAANQAAQDASDATTYANTAADSATREAQNALAVANAAQTIADDAQETADEARRIIQEGTVASFNGRAGVVVPQLGDYDATLIEYDSTNTVAQKIAANTADITSAVLQLNTFISTPKYTLDTTAASGTLDGNLYRAITSLGWGNEVIDNA